MFLILIFLTFSFKDAHDNENTMQVQQESFSQLSLDHSQIPGEKQATRFVKNKPKISNLTQATQTSL